MSDRRTASRLRREELDALEAELLPDRISMSLMSVPAPVHVPPAANVLPDDPVAEVEPGSDVEPAS
jgi:hypothetical protein